jgi:hypothetical protein
MNASVTYTSAEKPDAYLVINAPSTEERIPAHFILLLDTSDSMNEDDKLDHVKLCSSLLLKLLTPADKISLITFSRYSRIILRAVTTEASNLASIESAIASLQTEGCTNLSAGIASVAEVLALSPEKPTLLLLTDGHANRGVCGPEDLQRMMSGLSRQCPALGLSIIAYGTDHNAELLKGFATTAHGSYSIVESLESAATALGDALGGALSCVAQNVEILCPTESTIAGPYTCVNGVVRVGDLYGGSSTMFLMDLPGPVTVRGTLVPSMQTFTLEVPSTISTARDASVELTRLRYRCSDLFRRVRLEQVTAEEIAAFRTQLSDTFLAGNPITDMLLAEASSLEEAFRGRRFGDPGLDARILQHEAYTSLGRGTTQAIGADPTTVTSPMSSRMQQRLSMMMRTMSQEPENV